MHLLRPSHECRSVNSGPNKLLFDECIGKPHIERLASLVAIDTANETHVKHILDFQEPGVFDEVWVPSIRSEGWVVITQDRGRRRRGKGEQLSKVCRKQKITHVILSAGIAERRSFDKMLTILSLWYEILATRNAPPGSRFVIEPMTGNPADRTRGKLIDRTPPQSTPRTALFDMDDLAEEPNSDS